MIFAVLSDRDGILNLGEQKKRQELLAELKKLDPGTSVALRSGAFLGMLPDQDARKVGLHVPFFGRPASTHTGPARLAYRAGCPIAIGLIERESGARFTGRLLAMLSADPEREESQEVERLTRIINETIEAGVRKRPDHWYWLHRRWKTPPPSTS